MSIRCYYCPQPAVAVIEALVAEPLTAGWEVYPDYSLVCDRLVCNDAAARWADLVGIFTDRRALTKAEAEAITGETL